MASYAIMRINKCKIAAVGRLNKHHERLKEQYKSNPDIDQSRSHLNYHLTEPSGQYRQMILNRIDEVGAKRRKDSVVMQDCLVTASPDWIGKLNTKQQREYFEYAHAFFVSNFGEKNILSAVVHMDERNPHMHLTFVPITKDGRLSSKQIIGGPKGMVEWQDRFYEHIHEKYPELSRGIPVRVTKRKHIPPYLFKNAANLYEHYEEIERAVNSIGLIHSKEKKAEVLELLSRYAPEMAKMKQQITQVDSYIDQLKEDVAKEQKSSKYWYGKKEELEDAIFERDEKIRDLSWKQKELQRVIDRIPPDLLEEMKRREQEARRQRNRNYREER